jgi:hypothetical protein
LTKLDDAMVEQMAYIVLSETRPFSYRDFLKFKVNDKEYGMKHGTFRNKISKLMKNGHVELSYNSGCGFYTLTGHKFGKPMTPYPTVVHNNPIYRMIKDLPFDKQSIHDIRLIFTAPMIWKIASINPDFNRNKRSQDIVIPTWNKDNALIRTVIHKSDTVSVTIGCSPQPFLLDANGIINFYNLLVRIEEKLRSIFDNCVLVNYGKSGIIIPDYGEWVVTMWHFGRDASVEYSGEKFCVSMLNLQHTLIRIYVKDLDGKSKIRIEKQEYPKKTVLDAINERLDNKIDD